MEVTETTPEKVTILKLPKKGYSEKPGWWWFLVGGFNPFQKYARQIGSFLHVEMKIFLKIYELPPPGNSAGDLFWDKNGYTLRIQSPSQMMIGVYNDLLRKVFRFHYHSQKVIGSL